MAKRQAKGTGTIYYDKNKKLFIGQISNGYDENGKRKRETVSGKTKAEVQAKIKNIDLQIFTGTFVDKSEITIYHLAKQTLIDKLNQNEIQEVTYYRHLETLKTLKPIYNTTLQATSEFMLQSFFNDCLNYSQSNINKIYTLLSNTFNEARKRKIISDNPMEFIKRPKSRQIKQPVRALTREEQKKLTHVLLTEDINYSQQMLLSMSAGMRMGEINALSVEDINFKHNYSYVHRTISRGQKGEAILNEKTKTDAGTRKNPMTAETRELLAEAIGTKTSGLIFTHKDKLITTNQVNAQFNRILKKYDILDKSITEGKVDLHSLRHTFGTRCVEAGMPPEVLKELMGHTDITVTMNTYYYATHEHITNNLKRVENILSKDGLSIAHSKDKTVWNRLKIV